MTVKRATGMPWNRVVRKHAVPNALLPLVTLAALQFGAVAGGVITIETIFSWPGLGELDLQRDQRQGLPGPAGHVPRLLGRGDRGEPGRRRALLRARSEGARRMSETRRDSCCSAPSAGCSASACSGCSCSSRVFGCAARAGGPARVEHRRARGADRRRTRSAPPRRAPTCSPSCMVGARVSIVVGFAAAVISAVLGAAVGLIGGYFGGWTDRIFDAFENWFLVIPTLPLMVVLARLLDPSLTRADPRDRADELGRHGADRALAGADAARSARSSSGRGRWGRGTATSSAPTSSRTRCR